MTNIIANLISIIQTIINRILITLITIIYNLTIIIIFITRRGSFLDTPFNDILLHY